MRIRIDPTLKQKLKIGYLVFEEVQNRKVNEALWSEFRQLMEEYRRRFQTPSQATQILAPARKLYRSIGVEPTKTRPSSEALLRRVLKGKSLYRIHSIVDSANYCALKMLLPIGLYDLDKISGDILLRTGYEGEHFTGIRKDRVNVAGRIVLCDAQGPFGNPTSDSERTSVSLQTTRLLMVLFYPFEYPQASAEGSLTIAAEVMLRFNPARLVQKELIK